MSDPTKARCYDPTWRYVPKDATDISKTFARIRRQQVEAAKKPQPSTVRPLRAKKEAQ